MKTLKTQQVTHYPSNDHIVATLKVSLDRKSFYYGRVSETIFMGLEAIGGFYESLHMIGYMLVFFVSRRLFISAFINSMYQIEDPNGNPEQQGIDVRQMF